MLQGQHPRLHVEAVGVVMLVVLQKPVYIQHHLPMPLRLDELVMIAAQIFQLKRGRDPP